MGLYNFQARFVEPIRTGDKTQTIRAPRKGHEDWPGDFMHMYTGLRKAGAQPILEYSPMCTRLESIVILKPTGLDNPIYIGPFLAQVRAHVDRQMAVIEEPERFGLIRLTGAEGELLAWRDGFTSLAEMLAFWQHRLPFYGHIFHWS